MDNRYRRLSVPFNVFKPATVPVYLIKSTKVEGEAPLAVLVDVERFIDRVLVDQPVVPKIAVDQLRNCAPWAEAYGVQSKRPLVMYPDLSRYGWGLRPREGQNSAKASYWTVFFAQNVLRGLCMRLIGCEMDVLARDAAGEEVYFKPWVKMLRKEVKAYRRVRPVKDMASWVDEEVRNTWRRIEAGLTQEVNRKALEGELRARNVVAMRKEGV